MRSVEKFAFIFLISEVRGVQCSYEGFNSVNVSVFEFFNVLTCKEGEKDEF